MLVGSVPANGTRPMLYFLGVLPAVLLEDVLPLLVLPLLVLALLVLALFVLLLPQPAAITPRAPNIAHSATDRIAALIMLSSPDLQTM
jgi:hypothetical protein